MQPSKSVVPFIKLPNNLIWNRNVLNEKSLVEKATDALDDTTTASMLPEAVAQLNWRINRMNFCTFTILGLVKSCGYIPKTGANKSISKFRDILILLEKWGYITDIHLEEKKTLETVSASTEITCVIKNNFIKKGEADVEFFMLDLNTYNILFKESPSSSFRRNILNVYFYISARLPATAFNSKLDFQDGKMHFCYFGQGEIASSLQITRNTVLTCLKKLEELDLIYYGNIGTVSGTNYKKEKGVINAKTVYSKTSQALEQGLRYSEHFYETQGYLLPKDVNVKTLAKSIIKKNKGSKGGNK
jgi:hypothetical protein